MVSLCPTCHRKADKGNYSEGYLRNAKKNPYNKGHVEEAFLIEGQDLVVKVDDVEFQNIRTILRINDFDLISIRKGEKNLLFLDLTLYDRLNNIVAVILENNWVVDTSLVWDVEYKPQHLIIRNKPRKILFDIAIVNGKVQLRGEMYFRGSPIRITDREVFIADANVTLGGFSLINKSNMDLVAINYQVP
jgi:hypothetical protein